jgi:murein endopeptidase
VRGGLSSVIAMMIIGGASVAHAQLVPVPCVIIEGETIAAVAARFRVTLGDLSDLNGDTDLSALAPGAEISVGYGERVEHTVVRGDTLLRLARHYGVTATDIARWNGLADPRRMRADTTLLIYAWPRIPPSSSIGGPSHGRLENGVRLPRSPFWEIHDRERAYMTRDAAAALEHGFEAVIGRFAEAPRIEIRDASIAHGGPLFGHHSHQSGRDVDIAYYRRSCRGTCAHHRVTAEDLDAERQWALIEPWLRGEQVDYIFVDHGLQEPLYRAARAAGASAAELARWFQWPGDSDRHVGVIRHADGHRDHLHVRFACAIHDRECGPRRGSTEETPESD